VPECQKLYKKWDRPLWRSTVLVGRLIFVTIRKSVGLKGLNLGKLTSRLVALSIIQKQAKQWTGKRADWRPEQ